MKNLRPVNILWPWLVNCKISLNKQPRESFTNQPLLISKWKTMFNAATFHANYQSFWHNGHRKWKQKGVERVCQFLVLAQHENLGKITIYQNNNCENISRIQMTKWMLKEVEEILDSLSSYQDQWLCWAISQRQVFSFCIEFLCVGADLDVDFAELLLIFSMVDKVTVTLSSTFHSQKKVERWVMWTLVLLLCFVSTDRFLSSTI